LIAIKTLEAMALGMLQEIHEKDFLVCPMIDARRMEVYVAVYDQDLTCINETEALIISSDSFQELLKDNLLYFGGDGAAKCKEVLGQQKNGNFMSTFHPSANHMSKLSEEKFNRSEFEDVAYFEPFYLKDFVAGIPKVKGLK
jgi:tRNA threonylcarbamoyladenosine biosynthesis protein TsaB